MLDCREEIFDFETRDNKGIVAISMIGVDHNQLDIETILHPQTQIPQFILLNQHLQKLPYLLKHTILTISKARFKILITSYKCSLQTILSR